MEERPLSHPLLVITKLNRCYEGEVICIAPLVSTCNNSDNHIPPLRAAHRASLNDTLVMLPLSSRSFVSSVSERVSFSAGLDLLHRIKLMS